jgi:hypothetical protein
MCQESPPSADLVLDKPILTNEGLSFIFSPDRCANCTYNDPNVIHEVIYSANNTGQWDKFDSYIISDTGQIATWAAFANTTSGSSFNTTLLKYNFEQIVTASEFQGRSIDLVVAPKMFIQSGLIP